MAPKGEPEHGAPEPLPDFGKFVPQVRALADAPFRYDAFMAACETLGWRRDERASHESASFFRIPSEPGLWLLVSHPYDWDARKPPDHIACAILHLSYWEEEWIEALHDDPAKWRRQRDAFDATFLQARGVVERQLGPLLLDGQDSEEDRHRYAIWRGRTALLILQQCAFDVQFGLEINIWLHPWPESAPLPAFTSPLINWLMRTESAKAA